MISIEELTIDQVHASYKAGEYTCRQLIEAYLARIQSLDQQGPKLNAITTISHLALSEADALDASFKATRTFTGSLHGIPVIVKDQCDTKGVTTTYGNICCKHVPLTDATLVKNLRAAGAVILAKSTMPDFAASFNSCSSVSGETLNPYDTTRETGGSSAGTGAAIAANYGLIGVGEDTGGSIRVPASFCNLVGLRPTVGLISRAGLSPLVKTQDTPGPMTRTVRDAALMMDVLVGYDERDSYTAAASIAGPPRGGSYASNLTPNTLSKARIGILQDVAGTSKECQPVNDIMATTISKISKNTTCEFLPVTIPNLEYYIDFTSTYYSRSRHDIDTFLSTHPILKNISVSSIHASKSYHPSLPLFDRIGTGPTHPYQDPDYAARLGEQAEFQRLVIGIMTREKLDAIVYPSVQIPPPKMDDVLGDRFRKEPFPTNTSIASQLRMPAISVSVGFTEEGLPVGLELLGGLYQEQRLLELAFGVESLMNARRAPTFDV